MKYRVVFHVDATGYITVEAESEAQARQIANDEFAADYENTEIGDAVEIVDVLELDDTGKLKR